MNLAAWIPFWNSLDAVRRVHSDLEAVSIGCFLLLALFDAFAHWTKDKDRGHTLGAIGICFFFLAVTFEFGAYVYGQRNDELSENVIKSLDSLANDAEAKSAKSVIDSGTALTNAGIADVVAAGAVVKADKVRRTVEAVSKHADAVDSRVGQTQLLVSSRSILNLADFKKAVRSIEGKTVYVRSYSGDIEGYFLCTSIVSTLRPEVNANDECGKVPPFTPPVTNVALFGSTDEEMASLVKVFIRAGIQGGLTSGPYGNATHSSIDVVFVGAKAPFSMVQGPIMQPPKVKQKNR